MSISFETLKTVNTDLYYFVEVMKHVTSIKTVKIVLKPLNKIIENTNTCKIHSRAFIELTNMSEYRRSWAS